MLKAIERLGDQMLTLAVPRVSATADPGCECRGFGEVKGGYCGCICITGQIVSTRYYQRFRCDGCHWVLQGCNWSSWTPCGC